MEWHLIIKYFRNECDIAERQDVESWINISEENRKIFINLKEIWETAEKAPDNINPDFEKAWGNIQQKTGLQEKQTKQETKRISLKQILKVAAVILIIIGFGTLIQLYTTKSIIQIESTASTDKKEILLADGTTIFLNQNSKITFPKKFSGTTREIQREGEAFFNVAKDSKHPFIIHAQGTEVKVLGTSFNIRANDPSQVLVSVLTGKVAFRSENINNQSIYLEKGDCGRYNLQTQQFSKSQFSDENFMAWKTGILNFNNTTLNEAIQVLSEYYSKPFEVEPILQHRQITVSFDNQPLEEVLKILEIKIL